MQQQFTIDVVLEIGQMAETVNVVADASILETMTSSVGKVVDNARIQALPLNTRNIYSLIYLTPGVTGGIGNSHNQVGYSVNGVRGGLMETLIDGSSAAFPTVNGFHGISVFPSVDAVQEFKVQGGNYSAEFGRSLGSVLNLVYKSGTNAFHGTGYEFYRDSALDSNTYFNKLRDIPLADFSRSQFGGMTGGPIVRDRTFFMVSYEGLRQDGFRELLTTVPTALERSGDFSQTRGANGQPIVDLRSGDHRAQSRRERIHARAVSGNRIPRDRMDPVALNVLKYWPEPNQAGDPATGRNNFYASGSAQVNTDNFDIRIDQMSPRTGACSAATPIATPLTPRRSCSLAIPASRKDASTSTTGVRTSCWITPITRGAGRRPECAPRVRAQPVPVRQPGARLLTDEPRFSGRHRGERRSARCSRRSP